MKSGESGREEDGREERRDGARALLAAERGELMIYKWPRLGDPILPVSFPRGKGVREV